MLSKLILSAAALIGSVGVASPILAQTASHATSVQWTTDFESASVEAKRTSKSMLVLFTGSDWCGACKRLQSEVLAKPEFAQAFGEKYIFVEIDFPMRNRLSPEQTQKNKELQKKYNVQGFPTLIVLDANQKQVGQPLVGYAGDGLNGYVAQIDSMK